MEKVGFIGLGRMGRPMASNLVRKGFRLTVNDINPDAVKELELLQASSAPTVAEVTQKSDIIVTMLPNSAVVEDVITRADGIIANAKPGSLILDMSTDRSEHHGQAGESRRRQRHRLCRCAGGASRQPRRSR